MKRGLLAVLLLILGGLLAACGAEAQENAPVEVVEVVQEAPVPVEPAEAAAAPQPAEPAESGFASQSNDEKAVTVEVTPLNLGSGAPSLDFEVAFNTHSEDLSFDPAQSSVLRDAAGREYLATAWEGSGPGGHHRSGVLRFEAPEDAGASVEVVIRDVAGVPERVFHWDLP
jgi:hypothetical protein